MPDDRKSLGMRCEAIAAEYLAERGYRVRHRNFRTKLGEVDLICEDGPTVVFVEVKARRSIRFGEAYEAVGYRKQQRIMAIAGLVMANWGDRPCRFDVVAVTFKGSMPVVEHLIDAFP
ncbi:MAG TPA: YraN family protein [Oscillatoriaceae cyanobacterium]